jgi:cytochrome o ubiquinol oxidase subunit 2
VPSTTKSKKSLGRIIVFALLILVIVGVGLFLLLHGTNIAVFSPKGVIATKQKDLIIFTTLLSMIVIIPVFVMLFAFAWKYRASNENAKYTPNADHNKWIETVWWGVPIIIILILGVVTWNTSYELDPYRALDSQTKPLTIKVVSLQWKWLFIYPNQSIATINEVRFPEKTPINFLISADSPMNSFWIPNLGSQMYAMNGMTSQLHLEADKVGEYRGSSTNISGKGYAGMNFKAISMSKKDFDDWAQSIDAKKDHLDLDWNTYQALAKPSSNQPVAYYMLHDPSLFEEIVDQYVPSGDVQMSHGYIQDHDEGMN